MRRRREDLEQDRDHLLEETLAVLQSLERIWLAMDNGNARRSQGYRQLFEKKDRLITLAGKNAKST